MPAVLLSHHVADFAAWLKVFEAHATARQAAGFRNTAVWQSAADPNHVFIYLEGENLEKMEAFSRSDELRQRMRDGGVISVPEVHFLDYRRNYPH